MSPPIDSPHVTIAIDNMANMGFGEWLVKERERRGWSQAELARRAKMARQLVSRTELGVSQPMPDTLSKIARALQYPIETVYQAAGMLPLQGDTDPWVETQKHKLARLRPSLRDVAANVLNSLLDQQDREQAEKEKTDRGKTRPARP